MKHIGKLDHDNEELWNPYAILLRRIEKHHNWEDERDYFCMVASEISISHAIMDYVWYIADDESRQWLKAFVNQEIP